MGGPSRKSAGCVLPSTRMARHWRVRLELTAAETGPVGGDQLVGREAALGEQAAPDAGAALACWCSRGIGHGVANGRRLGRL